MSSPKFNGNILLYMTILEPSFKQENQNQNRHPRPIHRALLVLLALFVAVKAIMLLVFPQPAAFADDLTMQNILQAVNRERSLRNLLTLNTDSRLSTAAQSKADDMEARGYFAHVDPDGNYIWPKIVAAGYSPYLQLGENLAIEFYDTESLVSAWMNSPTHRANILNDGFRDQGMGVSFGPGPYHSAVANTFGTLVAAKKPAEAPAPEPSVSGQQQPTPAAPAPAPKPAPTPKPPATPAPAPEPEPAPAPTAPTQPTTQTPPAGPLSPRGDYALGPNIEQQPSSAATAATSAEPAVINPEISDAAKSRNLNRYFTLAFGIVLFLFLLTDLQSVIASKSELLGKKISNLVLLLLALIVVAVMYWL